jgi:hypothetical protein
MPSSNLPILPVGSSQPSGHREGIHLAGFSPPPLLGPREDIHLQVAGMDSQVSTSLAMMLPSNDVVMSDDEDDEGLDYNNQKQPPELAFNSDYNQSTHMPYFQIAKKRHRLKNGRALISPSTVMTSSLDHAYTPASSIMNFCTQPPAIGGLSASCNVSNKLNPSDQWSCNVSSSMEVD